MESLQSKGQLAPGSVGAVVSGVERCVMGGVTVRGGGP